MIRFINKFDKRLITDYLNYKLKSVNHFHNSFDYLITKLPKNNLKDLSECEWYETKNYDFCLIVDKEITVIIRQYQRHFTLFFQMTKDKKSYNDKEYGIITFFANTDLMKEDEWTEDNYKELNAALPKMFAVVKEESFWLLSNSISLPVEKYVEIKLVLDGNEIHDIDAYIFALEEMFRLHSQIFCETEMVAKLNDFKIGDNFAGGIITNIRTEDFYYGKEPYYHGIGIEFKKDGKEEFKDVYSLARWYYDDIFGKEKFEIRRKFLIKYKDTYHAISYNKGWWMVYHEHKLNDKTIYASTPDIEIVKELLKVDYLDTDIVTIEEEKRKID